MRMSLLFLQTRLAAMFLGILVSSVAFGQELKHSYTFDDGTANDAVGTVHGAVQGAVTLEDGKAIVTGATTPTDAYITFDGVALDLASYSAITLEFFVETENVGNTSYTMLAYFGNNTGGNRCFWVQPTRNGNETRIEANNNTTSVTALLGGYELDDGKKHHVVAILTETDIKYYIDGGLVGSNTLPETDYITQLDTEVANLFKGADGWGDPNYNCALDEFNIYDGEMSAAEIGQKGAEYAFGEGAFNNADLDTLYANKGELSPEFSAGNDFYELEVPFGTLTLNLTATPVVSSATVEIRDGLGNLLEDGVVPVDAEFGAELTITVNALDGSTTKEYYVLVTLGEPLTVATLSEIQIVPDGKLVPEFVPDSTNYVAVVPRSVTSVEVTGIPASSGATVTGGGTVELVDGMGSTSLNVVSEDGSNTMVYNVEISASLTEVGEEYYIVNTYNNQGYVAGETGNATSDIATQLPLKGEPGQLWTLEESGVEGQYFIKSKNGSYWKASSGREIWNMEASPGLPNDLDSARFILDEYELGTFIIECVARKNASSTNFRVGPNDGNLNSTIFNDKWVSDTWTPYYSWQFKPASEVVPDYDNNLESLNVTPPGNLVFEVSTTEYFITVPQGTTSVEVTASPRDVTSTVTGTGTVAITGNEGTITVTCTASTGETKDYVVNYVVDTDLTLMHSYTFADGTARDVVGSAHGTVNGGTIDEGVYTTFENGQFIDLPGEEIAINTYPSITLEIYTNDQDDLENGNWTMLGYFGDVNGTNGANYLFFSLANGDGGIARAAINGGSGETSVSTNTLKDDFLPHHVVTILTNDSIKYYVDGQFAGSTATSATNKIANIGNAFAFLNKGGFSADPTWMGDIYEYNIYAGQMDEETIALHAIDFPSEDASGDATLSSLLVGGVEINGFASYTMAYDSVLAQGTTEAPEVAGIPKNLNATVTVTQATSVTDSAKIEVTSENGNFINTYYVKFEVSTAVGEITSAPVKVYPTVTNGSFRVVSEGSSSVISVYNLKGSLVQQRVTNQNEEFISLQDAGMYIVKVETQGISKTFKVIKTN